MDRQCFDGSVIETVFVAIMIIIFIHVVVNMLWGDSRKLNRRAKLGYAQGRGRQLGLLLFISKDISVER